MLKHLTAALLCTTLGQAQEAKDYPLKFLTDPPGAQIYMLDLAVAPLPEYRGLSGAATSYRYDPKRAGNPVTVTLYYPDIHSSPMAAYSSAVYPNQLIHGQFPQDGRPITLNIASAERFKLFGRRFGLPIFVGVLAALAAVYRAARAVRPQDDTTLAMLLGQLPRPMGRYTLEAKLGSGGFGDVFKASDDQGQPVAVKLLKPEMQVDTAATKRFFREIQVLCGLQHPNIVKIYDWGENDDGSAYLAMELLEGRTLGAVLGEKQRLTSDELLALLPQIESALQALHQQGLVHRDLKPDNVFLQKNGRLKLMDFGSTLGTDLTRATRTGVVMGTPTYMAPEQIKGHLDAASDQYALGVLLFIALTGRKPFETDDPVAMAYSHVHHQPPRPSEFVASLPEAVDAAVLRMLAKEPKERFPDIQSATRALIEALQSKPHEGFDEATIAN
jgi:hypothetical protein